MFCFLRYKLWKPYLRAIMERDMKAVSDGSKRKADVLETCLQQMRTCFLDVSLNFNSYFFVVFWFSPYYMCANFDFFNAIRPSRELFAQFAMTYYYVHITSAWCFCKTHDVVNLSVTNWYYFYGTIANWIIDTIQCEIRYLVFY